MLVKRGSQTHEVRVGPRAYICDKTTAQSVKLSGRYINLRKLADDHDLDHSYLSRIMSGQRTASVAYMKRVAGALLMGLDELIDAIEERHSDLQAKRRERLAS